MHMEFPTKLSVFAFWFLLVTIIHCALAQESKFGEFIERPVIVLTSKTEQTKNRAWQMARADKTGVSGDKISQPNFQSNGWSPAIVPGTVLNSLVANRVYPEPYFGMNNAHERNLIPDISQVGTGFYTYWFRSQFVVPNSFRNRRVWMQFDGINYRAEIWINGREIGQMAGMFRRGLFDVTEAVKIGAPNALAVLVKPIDEPNGFRAKSDKPRAVGENRNGADGTIGRYTTMLMTAGWDFTFPDGIRDRNTGIWRDIKLFSTGSVSLRHPFVKTDLSLPDTKSSRQTISVELTNSSSQVLAGVLRASIPQSKITLQKTVRLAAGETRVETFTPEEFAVLRWRNPRLWWPFNKGEQFLYNLNLEFVTDGKVSDTLKTRFGVRDIRSDRNTPDKSRIFYVNGKRLFLHGSNWIPEAMLRNSPERMNAELRYTRQAGVNFLRFWAGGVTESDQFFDLCDELGILVWTEFWQSGDTKIPETPEEIAIYRANVEDTVKRIRPHASLAYYVSANERSANNIVPITDLLDKFDGTRGWQAGSETDGIHDGSPYVTVNPMFYYEDTASTRGSRINGLCPEYGAPILPTIDALREMMPAKDLWPIDKTTWDYMDGGGFHQMTTEYKRAVEQYGKSSNIEDFAWKSQMFGALAYRSIWEVWNANRFEYGDRFSTGLLFWYHNSPQPQVADRMWDWSLEPTAALYFSQDAHEPLHAQFDFLKNTVSVNNEWPRSFANYNLRTRIFNLDMTPVYNRSVKINVPADRLMSDVWKVELPPNLSPVHFIRLDITDAQNRPVADTFYWRSNHDYTRGRTMTGPLYEGFEDINALPTVKLRAQVLARTQNGQNVTTARITNPSKSLAFMVWLRLQDLQGKPVRPAFYSDNFVSLLPGESRTIRIENANLSPNQTKLIIDGWNVAPLEFHNGKFRTLPIRERQKIATTRANNLALNKPVISSGDESAERAAKFAVDGSSGTRWASARTDNQWLMVDLGTPQTFSQVLANWEQAFASEYKIQVSDDARNWKDVAHITQGKGGEETQTFAPVTARYVRLLGIKRATEFGYSLWEFGVYATENQ